MSNQDFVRSLPSGAGLVRPRQLYRLHLDPLLLVVLLLIVAYGLVVLYSAINRDQTVFSAQLVHMGVAVLDAQEARYAHRGRHGTTAKSLPCGERICA